MMNDDEMNYAEYRLDNGIRITELRTPAPTLTMGVRIDHASLHENGEEHGMAHFTEHGIFSSRKNYGTNSAYHTRASFGFLNAFTDLVTTLYQADFLPRQLNMCSQFMQNEIFNPKFSNRIVTQESKIILRELADEQSSLRFHDGQDFQRALYGKTRSYYILGSEETIEHASPLDLHMFHARGYVGKNTSVYLAGTLPENSRNVISSHFGKVNPGRRGRVVELPELRPLKHPVIIRRPSPDLVFESNPSQSSCELVMGIRVPWSSNSKDTYAIHAMTEILGSADYFNSKLFRIVREKHGLVYHISSLFEDSREFGAIEIQAQVPSKRVDKTIDLIFDVFRDMQNNPVNTKELDQIRDNAEYRLQRTLYNSIESAKLVEYMWDKRMLLPNYVKALNTITPRTVQEAANKYLPSRREYGNYVLLIRDPLMKEGNGSHASKNGSAPRAIRNYGR